VTINAGNKCLLLANLVCELFESDYGPYLSHRGACYYETIEGRLIRNQNYGGDFELRQLRAGEFSSVFGCFAPFEKGLLAAAKDYANIEFLAKPETFY
jgi:hypothetical protein